MAGGACARTPCEVFNTANRSHRAQAWARLHCWLAPLPQVYCRMSAPSPVPDPNAPLPEGSDRAQQPVTSDILNVLYSKLLDEYWGDALTPDDRAKMTWARIPHFFQSPYYVYQYATGIAGAPRPLRPGRQRLALHVRRPPASPASRRVGSRARIETGSTWLP